MAKPDPALLALERYPVVKEQQTRFQDMDPNGHINNVAFAALFESARVELNRGALAFEEIDKGARFLVAAVSINYLAEGNYPDPVSIGSGVLHIGNSSWVIAQLMVQNGKAIATCDSTIVMRRADGSGIPDAFRERLGSIALT
jgi:acyl-CoA thioester hydrolase